jgi:RNA polymerase sigma-70 factor (ECF subfamily)
VENDADQVLVERCRAGDREAFTELVVRYQRPIYNAALWILRKPEDASDVAQTVFVKVAEQLDDYDPQFRFFSWIYRIAVNESLNALRRSRHHESFDDAIDVPSEGASPESQLAESERVDRVRRALAGMSTNDRVVLTLRHFAELSYQEIAQALDIDEKTVKSRLFEARHRLRETLRDLKTT